jgi:peptidoglycan/LPS O-acetylase OafA/YrhL
MEFRADVNGLRAIAILSVILYHYGFPGVTGGFVGVDIFFVISGFLLTSIAVSGIRNGTYRWQDFLLHRARRIVPALAVMLLGVLLLGAGNFLSADYDQLSKYARSSILFVSNISYYSNSGYFSPDAKTNMLLHTWSLSVEWQFYLLFAFLCMVFWPKDGLLRKKLGKIAFWSVVIGSLAWALLKTPADPHATFYLLPARAWEFMVGSLVAVHGDSIRKRMNTSMLGALGILLLGLSIFGFSAGDAFPGWRAMLPVLGSAALIAAQRSKINEWLATAPFQFFGNISYSLYLWHWPVLVWAKYTLGNVTPLQSAGLLGIALALSVLSWRFVEKPTRRSLSGFRVSTAYASAILIAITWSVLVHKEHGFPTRLPDYLIQAAEAATLKNPHQEACFNDPSAMSHPDGCVEGNGNTPPSIALWGDSHADQLQNVVEQLLSGDRLLVLTYGGCPPLIGHAGPGSGVDSSVNCESFANRSYQHLL